MEVLWLETQKGNNNKKATKNAKKRPKKQVSMKLMASLAPARAEIEAGVVAKADQKP